MRTINTAAAQENLQRLIEDVNSGKQPVTIAGSSGKNAVLISEAEWKSIQETVYLHSVPGLAESIIDASSEPLDDGVIYDEDEEW